MAKQLPIAVLGAGSWGTALALVLAQNQQDVRLWDYNAERVAQMQSERCNSQYLPNIPLPDNLSIYVNLTEVLADVDTVLIVVPSHAFRSVLEQCMPMLRKDVAIVWGTKGIDMTSCQLLHELVIDKLGAQTAMAAIAGPNFAKEVALRLPSATTLASNDMQFAKKFQQQLHNNYFRVYTSDDLIGVQICSAVKNVLAIAVGISDGLNLGANARCALITRGLAEMSRLGMALGGKQTTFMGLAGVGDLVLTCTDNQSRNRRFGLALGSGKPSAQIKQELGALVEGADNVSNIYNLAKHHGIEMPITEQIYNILNHGVAPANAVEALLMRDPGTE